MHGLFPCALNYCKKISLNIRVDTHADNKTMQRLIEKNGFIKCGIIYVKNGTARIAYQRADFRAARFASISLNTTRSAARSVSSSVDRHSDNWQEIVER